MARVAIVEIDGGVFGYLMRGRRDAAITSNWPDDAKIVGGEWNLDRGRLRLAIESADFDEVPDGSIAPEWTPTITAYAMEPSAAALIEVIDKMKEEERADAAKA